LEEGREVANRAGLKKNGDVRKRKKKYSRGDISRKKHPRAN